MKKRYLILAVLAIAMVLSASIGTAIAYFTTYTDARGGYVIHMKYETEIHEDVEAGVKKITITNNPNTGTETGTYPVFVRVRIWSGSDTNIDSVSGTDWLTTTPDSTNAIRYRNALYTGETTSALEVKISEVQGAGVRPGDPVDVVITYESVPAVFLPNGDPDLDTAWANATAIRPIETIRG